MTMLNKTAMRDSIVEHLFKHVDEQLQKLIEKIILKSAIEKGLSALGCYFVIENGIIYYSNFPAAYETNINISIPEKYAEKFSMLCEMGVSIEMEKIVISSYLRDILNHCETIGDVQLFIEDKYLESIARPRIAIQAEPLAIAHFKYTVASGKKQEFDTLMKDRVITNLLIKNLRV